MEHPFLVCPENQLAYTAVFGVATPSGLPGGMIVTLFGPTGTGKSHLLREAARNFSRRNPTARVAQTTGHELVELIANAIENQSVQKFRDEYTTIDLLVCDGLDEIPNNEPIQEQFESLVDELTGNGGSILLASPRAPGELKRLSSRLANRCHGGIVAELGLPQAASRRKLLEHFAGVYRIPAPPDVVQRLAVSWNVSGREMLALLRRLQEFSRVRRRPMNLELLDAMLQEESDGARVPLSRVARAVAGGFGISLDEMQSGSRSRRNLVSRQTAMLLAREISDAPLAEIGDFFGGRNHSTVVHACQRARQLIDVDPEVASVVARIRQHLATTGSRGRRKPGDHASVRKTRAG